MAHISDRALRELEKKEHYISRSPSVESGSTKTPLEKEMIEARNNFINEKLVEQEIKLK